jgi:multidrug efflux system outer membrane protein
MKTRLMITVLVITSTLAGCTVGPKYRRPASSVPAVFRGADAATATDPASLGDLKWFEVFKDEQLQALIRKALVQNFDLQDAVARVLEARANLGITRSNQFPQISGSASLTSNQISDEGSFLLGNNPVAGFRRTRNFGSLLLNLASFEVDIWGRLRSATQAARANLLASDDNRKAVITTLISDVATDYFNLIELDMELEIDRRTLASRQSSLQLIKTMQQGGVATMLDVRQGEELVYGAAVTIPSAELQIEQTENQISLLLGQSPGPVRRGRSLVDQPQAPPVPPGLPSSLLQRRPDIRAAEENLIAFNANIGVARAQFFPLISLTGFLGTESSQLSHLFTGNTRAWNFVSEVSQPIFTGGRLKSNLRLAQAQRLDALVTYQKSIQSAFGDVSNALAQRRQTAEIRHQRELLVEAVRDRVSLAYMRFYGGVDTFLNALNADQSLFADEILLAEDRRNELLAMVQLYKALGGGWQQ